MKWLSLIILAAAAILGFNLWWSSSTKPASDETSLQRFLIPKGYSASAIADKLDELGLIRSPLAFRFYVQVLGKAKKIQAGEFRLAKSFSLFEIVDELTAGPVEVWVTIPEGLRREEIVERFIKGFDKGGQEVDDFRQEFLVKSAGKEGFLFPDTYLFPKTVSASAVVDKMLLTFDKRVDSQMRQDLAATDYDLKEVVILASIIVRETITKEERPVVAGILLKRLKAGWPLQVDASVQYVVADINDWWPKLTKENLEIKSAYNTYKSLGFPPAPIANPGLSSIKAAIYPEESPFWFYIHDLKGKIHYAKVVEEHNENVSKFLGK